MGVYCGLYVGCLLMAGPDFKALISDIKAQPAFRTLWNRCAAYKNHDQLTIDQMAELDRLGKPDLVENLIEPAVNSMIGNEISRRRDWIVAPAGDEWQEVTEGLSQKLNDTMRLCDANEKCTDAYESQVTAGMGWLHPKRSRYALESDYEIEVVHRDHIFWDILSRDRSLSDCKWLARQKFMDVDEATGFFPKKYHDLIKMLATGYSDPNGWEFVEGGAINSENSGQYYNAFRNHSGNIEYMIDSQRKRVAFYEVYYRTEEQANIVTYNSGLKEEFVKDDMTQLRAIVSRQAVLSRGFVRKMRQRIFIGPHEIVDRVSPYPHSLFPYVPFFGYREDLSNIPYGVVRSMLDSQDAFTNCNIEIHHILNSKRVSVNVDRLMDKQTVEDVVDEVNRRDGVIGITGNLKVGDVIQVDQDWQELFRLIELKREHEQKIRDVSGIHASFSGVANAAQSGIAKAHESQQSAMTLARIDSNYEYARQMLAELMLAYLVDDMGDQREEVSISESLSQAKRQVVLNDDSGGKLNNSIKMARYRVLVMPVQNSSGYRQHQNNSLMDAYASSPDDMKRYIWPMVISTSDWPNREEMLKKWNEQNGVVTDPDEQKALMEKEQAQKEKEMQMIEAERNVELELKRAQATERLSEAGKRDAEAAKVVQEIDMLKDKQENDELQYKDNVIAAARRDSASRELAEV